MKLFIIQFYKNNRKYSKLIQSKDYESALVKMREFAKPGVYNLHISNEH